MTPFKTFASFKLPDCTLRLKDNSYNGGVERGCLWTRSSPKLLILRTKLTRGRNEKKGCRLG